MLTYNKINDYLKYFVIIYIPLSLVFPVMAYVYRDNNRLIVMDAANTYHITEYTSREQLEQLYDYLARLAVNAFLMRNPTGLDYPTLFNDLYAGDAQKITLKQISREMTQFKEYDIHQKAEILKIKVIEADRKKSFVKIEGQLIRSFIRGMEKGTYTLNFETAITLETNFDLRSNAKYPYIATNITYKQEIVK